MTEHDIVLNAMKQANPVTEDELGEPPPDLSEVLGVITARPVAQKPEWRPIPVALGVFVAVVVGGLIGLLPDNGGTPLQPSDSADVTSLAPPPVVAEETITIESWCDAQRFEYEIDFADVDSVRSGYTGMLAADLFRKLFSPPELTDETDLVAAHTQSIVHALEAAEWDTASVDLEPPPDVVSARTAIDNYSAAACP